MCYHIFSKGGIIIESLSDLNLSDAEHEETMKQNMKIFCQQFYYIQALNWVKSSGNGSAAAGKTFEDLVGKAQDRMFLPDYLGIEIKTKSVSAKRKLCLFNMAPDSEPNIIRTLWSKCGWRSKKNDLREFFATVDTLNFSNEHRKYAFKLKVDYDNKCIRLCIRKNWDDVDEIDDRFFWTFQQLESRIHVKLSYFALIHYESKMSYGESYFKFTSLDMYRYRYFEKFLELIEAGKITIDFKILTHGDGDDFGKPNDKGTSFIISEDDLDVLFEKIPIRNYIFS